MNDWTNLAEAARLGGWVIYPLTVMAIPSGVYTITITGPVTITGTVRF